MIRPLEISDLQPCLKNEDWIVAADGRTLFDKGVRITLTEIALLQICKIEKVFAIDDDKDAQQIKSKHNVIGIEPIEAAPAQRLAEDVYSDTGVLLVKADQSLTDIMIRRIAGFGVQRIRVHLGKQMRPETREFKRARANLENQSQGIQSVAQNFYDWELSSYVDSWVKAAEQLSSTKFDPIEAELLTGMTTYGDFMWMIQFAGKVKRTFVISAQRRCGLGIAANALNLDIELISPEIACSLVSKLVDYWAETTCEKFARVGIPLKIESTLQLSGKGSSAAIDKTSRFVNLPLVGDVGWARIAVAVGSKV